MKLFKSTVAAIAVLSAATMVMADDISEEMRDVEAFTKVKLEGSMDVEVKVGSKQSVKVIADSDIIQYLRTRVHGGELEIDIKHKDGSRRLFRHIKKMQVIITVPSLEGAEVHGSGDMFVEDAVADKFVLEVHGSGDAVLENAKVETLDVELQGSGDIEMQGTCGDVRVELQGSGDIKGSKMRCKAADVMLQGSGDVNVYATASANVTVRGSGDIRVAGKPDKINSRVRGSGDIQVS